MVTRVHEYEGYEGRAGQERTWLKGLKTIARYLECSEKTALKYIRECHLPATKEGGGWLTSREAIDDWRTEKVQPAGYIEEE